MPSYPAINDKEFNLLKKITENTADIAAGGGGGGGAVSSVNTRTGAVVLSKSDVGLSNADNTSDANKPVSTAQQTALDTKLIKSRVAVSANRAITAADIGQLLDLGDGPFTLTLDLVATFATNFICLLYHSGNDVITLMTSGGQFIVSANEGNTTSLEIKQGESGILVKCGTKFGFLKSSSVNSGIAFDPSNPDDWPDLPSTIGDGLNKLAETASSAYGFHTLADGDPDSNVLITDRVIIYTRTDEANAFFPDADSTSLGHVFVFENTYSGSITLDCLTAGMFNENGTTFNTLNIQPGEVMVLKNFGTQWTIVSRSVASYTPSFPDFWSFTPATVTQALNSLSDALPQFFYGSATFAYGLILVGGFEDKTLACTGADVNDYVVLGLPSAPNSSIAFTAFVSSVNVVTIRAHNVGTVAVTPASATYRVTTIHVP